MATIGKLRQRSGIIIGFIFVAIVSFVATDLLKNSAFRGGSDANAIGTIYGEKYEPREYQMRLDKAINYRRNSLKAGESLSSAEEARIADQIWSEYVNEKLMDKELHSLGLTVTPEELIELSAGSNPHILAQQYLADPETRQINQQQILEFIRTVNEKPRDAQEFWIDFSELLHKTRLQEKYDAMVSKAMFVTDLEAKGDFIDKNRSATIQYVPLFTSAIADSTVNVTDADLKKYYDAHKEDFKREESRSFEYVTFDVKATSADTQSAEKWIDQQTEAFKNTTNDSFFVTRAGRGKFTNQFEPHGSFPPSLEDQIFASDSGAIIGPVFEEGRYKVAKVVASGTDSLYSMHASHILVSPTGGTRQDTADAFTKAREIMAELKKPGADFASIAREKSNDPGSAAKGGDLGWFREGQMVTPFNDAVKNGNTGDLLLQQSSFGIHIIKITKPKTKELRKVAILEREINPGNTTVQNVSNKAEEFFVAGQKDFDAAVADRRLTKRVAESVKPNDYTIAGLDNPRELIRWAYGQDAKVGDVSVPRKIGDKFVIAKLTRINKDGYAPLDDVNEQVKAFALQEKKKELLEKELTDAMDKSKKLEDIAASVQSSVSNADNIRFANTYVPNLGNEPALAGAAFGLPKGVVHGPIVGENGVFVISVTDISDIALPETFAAEARTQTAQRQQSGANLAMEALRKKADVKDYRYKFQ